ncbi:RDD family protein [Streptomyces sp. NBC_01304]|uniref:RDD family protein n=1 Tax=Streptomyces sp. NBC_01304 TaxID=2903818 RepID=UPI002E1234CF|nr:RDD family protein [Streptomyces sp. NBC_01304]
MTFGPSSNPYGPHSPQSRRGYSQQAPQYGYPHQPYWAHPSAGIPGAPGPVLPPLAHWGQRVGAYLLDIVIIAGPMYAVGGIGIAVSDDPDGEVVGILFLIGFLYTLGMAIFQLRQEGKTGQTIGKKVLGISLRREFDGSTLGFGMAFVRKLAHFLDGLPCYLGWFWPLWDSKRQTFADKVCNTVVIKVGKG